MIYEFPGDPIPLPRARATRSGFYDPAFKAKQNMVWYFKEKYPEAQVIETPVSISLKFEMKMPKSFSKKKRAQLLGLPHSCRCDLDNLCKFVSDAFNGVIWKDDALIWKIDARKVWAEEGRTVLEVE